MVSLMLDLAVADPHFGRLLRRRLVGEDANPDPPAPLDVACHRPACGLDLPRRQSSTADSLKAVLAEADFRPDGRNALVATLLLLAVFPPSWLQHFSLLRSCARASALPAPARGRPAVPRYAAAPRP